MMVDSSADFLIFDESALPDFGKTNFDFPSKPLVIGKQVVDCLLHEFVGATAGGGSKLIQLVKLIRSEVHFH